MVYMNAREVDDHVSVYRPTVKLPNMIKRHLRTLEMLTGTIPARVQI